MTAGIKLRYEENGSGPPGAMLHLGNGVHAQIIGATITSIRHPRTLREWIVWFPPLRKRGRVRRLARRWGVEE